MMSYNNWRPPCNDKICLRRHSRFI